MQICNPKDMNINDEISERRQSITRTIFSIDARPIQTTACFVAEVSVALVLLPKFPIRWLLASSSLYSADQGMSIIKDLTR